jgi:O-antigen/teichoic acid export membrane protein
MDMQMIIYLLGTQDAGYYTNYLSIISIPFMIITPIFALLFPVFSELHSKKEYSKITLIKNMLGKNLIHIAIMVNILFFVFAEILAYILF